MNLSKVVILAEMKFLKVMKSVWFVLLSLLLLSGCGLFDKTPQSQGLTSFEDVANYIKVHKKLPDNFITKEEARKLGWDPQKGNLHEVAPGKSIGGDVYQNREGKLPSKKGRIWYEADINYKSGHRGKDRIVFSNDGLIYKTEDHYETFEQIK
jgi:major membrane immunogen (membrane-anchored lipoprotein)